jgi:hypothetical protein
MMSGQIEVALRRTGMHGRAAPSVVDASTVRWKWVSQGDMREAPNSAGRPEWSR